MTYLPVFKNLQSIRRGRGQVLQSFKFSDTTNKGLGEFKERYHLHNTIVVGKEGMAAEVLLGIKVDNLFE